MNRFLSLVALAVALVVAPGCMSSRSADMDSDMDMDMDSDMDMDRAGVMVGGAMMLPTQTLVQNASEASTLTTLVAAVKAADLAGTLSGPGPFTVFAPANSAFDKLPDGTVASLTQPANKMQLTGILTYHVVPGIHPAGSLSDGQTFTTVNGEILTVRVNGGRVMIGNAKGMATVTQADVYASNGIAHVIDSVLMP